MTIALLSTTNLPAFLGRDHPDEGALFAEDDVLAAALARRGATAERVAWRQADAPWPEYDLVLVRSTWDYIDDLPAFLKVLGRIEAAGCRLVNPLATIRWNADKRYLAELVRSGTAVVTTTFVAPGEAPSAVLERLERSATGYILKPLVGVGAYGTERLADRNQLADRLGREDDAAGRLIQPFLTSVATEGEWSFVFGAGRFLYAALKTPQAGDFRVQVMYGATTDPKVPSPADLAAAWRCFHALPVPAEIARIDMARLPDRRLALMEAELIEPQLFLFDVPEAADRLADAILDLGAG
jgi:glutathione synthase/RimK-type ligase-like ATP-grasp enzyme